MRTVKQPRNLNQTCWSWSCPGCVTVTGFNETSPDASVSDVRGLLSSVKSFRVLVHIASSCFGGVRLTWNDNVFAVVLPFWFPFDNERKLSTRREITVQVSSWLNDAPIGLISGTASYYNNESKSI